MKPSGIQSPISPRKQSKPIEAMNQEEILTLEEVAHYLKLKPQTVYKWAQEERIPGTKLGKEWRFRKAMIDEWIDSSIILTKSGFDLNHRVSVLEAQGGGLSREERERILRESME